MILQNFITHRPYLFWHVGDKSHLSEAAIVEGVLNYGDWTDVKAVIKMLGQKKVARIFHAQTKGKRSNYDPKIQHFFTLYFKRHA